METKLKKCPACGNLYQENHKFCSCCGWLLSELNNEKEVQLDKKVILQDELKRRLSDPGVEYRGKEICNELRKLRLQFAMNNNLLYEEKECDHQGPCNGTCEYCEQKLNELNLAAEKAGIMDAVVYSDCEFNRIVMQNSSPRLMGMIQREDSFFEIEKSREKEKSVGLFAKLKKKLRK